MNCTAVAGYQLSSRISHDFAKSQSRLTVRVTWEQLRFTDADVMLIHSGLGAREARRHADAVGVAGLALVAR